MNASQVAFWTRILAAKHEWKNTHIAGDTSSILPQKVTVGGSGQLSCQVAALLGFPEVTNEIVMQCTLAHHHLKQTSRRDGASVFLCVCVCWLSHLGSSRQLVQIWPGFLCLCFIPAHLVFLSILLLFFGELFLASCLLLSLLRLFSVSPSPPPTSLSPWAVCDAVRRKPNWIASEFWTTGFNFRCLQCTIICIICLSFFPISSPQLSFHNLNFSLLRHLSSFPRRLLLQAHCAFGSPPALILTESKHSCNAGTTRVIDKPVSYRDRNTGCPLIKRMDSFFMFPVLPLFSLHPRPHISVEFLVTKWKHSHLLCQHSCTFLGSIIPAPTKAHMHSFTRGVLPSICWMDRPSRTSGEIRTAEAKDTGL